MQSSLWYSYFSFSSLTSLGTMLPHIACLEADIICSEVLHGYNAPHICRQLGFFTLTFDWEESVKSPCTTWEGPSTNWVTLSSLPPSLWMGEGLSMRVGNAHTIMVVVLFSLSRNCPYCKSFLQESADHESRMQFIRGTSYKILGASDTLWCIDRLNFCFSCSGGTRQISGVKQLSIFHLSTELVETSFWLETC